VNLLCSTGDSHDLLVRDKSVSTVVESERKFLVVFSNYALFLGACLPVIDIFVPATVFVTNFRFLSCKFRIRKGCKTVVDRCAGTATLTYLVQPHSDRYRRVFRFRLYRSRHYLRRTRRLDGAHAPMDLGYFDLGPVEGFGCLSSPTEDVTPLPMYSGPTSSCLNHLAAPGLQQSTWIPGLSYVP
jgi:hypothetical protein